MKLQRAAPNINILEDQIADLEQEKEIWKRRSSSGELGHEELQEKSNRYNEVVKEIEERTERWFELAERV
ncbi:MAG: ABC transporter C-terminal domain-containing protein [Balneolaceae bacterium]|nr:ABC transporter C-terminal domain-containing protein [Balneolaceae bacterium]